MAPPRPLGSARRSWLLPVAALCGFLLYARRGASPPGQEQYLLFVAPRAVSEDAAGLPAQPTSFLAAREADAFNGQEATDAQPAETSTSWLAVMGIACVAALAGLQQPASAASAPESGDVSSILLGLPPEEQQGYVQNTLGYFNLIINFLAGFFGSLFGPIARQLVKPGPFKYVIVIGIIGAVAGLVLTVRAMLGVQ
mmetsp:Transcript_40458/g.91323  ORF Transcript_40458/g.91323 Transcript_40458/m.91323 type:complete len:197 (+) Transcript_40458:82-672(+)